MEIKAKLEHGIRTHELTLEQFQDSTWGVEIAEGRNGRFVVFPHEILRNLPWTWDGRPPVRLSRK